MSVDGSGSHSGRKRKVTYVEEEDWGDDVSVLSRDDKSSVGTIILKILLGLIFIGSATGAIVYAVINSEESQNQPIDENATLYFPYDIDQQCFNGTLTMQYRVGVVDGQEQYTFSYYGTDWVQDATKKRLYHRVGLTPNDWQYSYYVFEDVTFFQTKKRCTKMEQGYADFIEGMGLTYIRKKRDEKVSLNGHFKEVIVYEGEPPEDVTVNGRHPSLIRGYSSEQRNVTYGWELFFSHSTNFSLYTEEYWYPSMKSTKPDWSIFNDIPNSCLDS
ncbi:hypothetical protein ANCCAN_16388 [Ancylostoma caninum]|uniref:Uncharacterized protein n=1 Tax=Ancylostoma caninum TaxID=29170 RepID=A0A368FZR7_ANCCA|nr:hypothetical protein ANCCAN_16388 [Ancylostoma caninum]